MPRTCLHPDDPKRSCNLTLRGSVVDLLDEQEKPRSQTVEELVETYLGDKNFAKSKLMKKITNIQEEARRSNIEISIYFKDIPPKHLETTSKPEDEGVLREVVNQKVPNDSD